MVFWQKNNGRLKSQITFLPFCTSELHQVVKCRSYELNLIGFKRHGVRASLTSVVRTIQAIQQVDIVILTTKNRIRSIYCALFVYEVIAYRFVKKKAALSKLRIIEHKCIILFIFCGIYPRGMFHPYFREIDFCLLFFFFFALNESMILHL